MPATILPLTEDDLEEASKLCMRSKAHWGYDAAFMAMCRDELTFRPADLGSGSSVGLWDCDALLGVAQLIWDDTNWELEKLFVDPLAMGSGIGRQLFAWAVATVGGRGGETLSIAADPHSAAFYRTMGAQDAGRVPSASISGRSLPLLRYEVCAAT